MKKCALCLAALAVAVSGCSSSDDKKTDAQFKREITNGMQSSMLADVQTLHGASQDLANAAPTPSDRGWDPVLDKDAIDAMIAAWKRARTAYERTEGAIAPIFPDIDAEIDARYDDFLAAIGPGGDQDLFDGQGVTGMHAIERILYQPSTPQDVIDAEATLPGYKAAAWPATAAEAAEFKSGLAAQLVTDTGTLLAQWTPQQIDIQFSFQGLIALMNEQREKVVKAASFEEESRYSERTLADVRDNLAGTRDAYTLFEPWVATKDGGSAVNEQIESGFDALNTAYSMDPGDAMPKPPADWSSEMPSATDLATPFGVLYTSVFNAVDPNRAGSVVDGMNHAARDVGLLEFTE